MQVDCTQIYLDEDGRIVSTIVVENDSPDTDSINHIHLARTEPDADGGVIILSSIPQVDVVILPGAGWEGKFTWSSDASEKVRQFGAAMVLVEFAHSTSVGSAFMMSDIQDESSGGGGLWQRARTIGWALLIAGLITAMYAVVQNSRHHQQADEVANTIGFSSSGGSGR